MHVVRNLRRWFIAGACMAGACIAVPSTVAAQQSAQTPPPRLGTVAGIVHEPDGTPVADAEVQLARSGRTARTASNGQFIMDSVPAGPEELVVRRLGYLPARAVIRVEADSAVMLSIALVGDAQALAEVRILGRRQNLLRGTVLDANDQPVPGAQVSLVGTDLDAVTDSTGRFIFRELPTGQFLLQARKIGFDLAQHSVRMVDRLERDVTMRLKQGAYPLSAIEIGVARIVARETMTRQAFREHANTAILGREELARYGSMKLDDALIVSRASTVRSDTISLRDYCIVVDGWRAIGRNSDRYAQLGSSAWVPPAGLAHTFLADEVELIEVYPEETEHSGTLCGRLGHSSDCGCPPYELNPPTLVIWLRK